MTPEELEVKKKEIELEAKKFTYKSIGYVIAAIMIPVFGLIMQCQSNQTSKYKTNNDILAPYLKDLEKYNPKERLERIELLKKNAEGKIDILEYQTKIAELQITKKQKQKKAYQLDKTIAQLETKLSNKKNQTKDTEELDRLVELTKNKKKHTQEEINDADAYENRMRQALEIIRKEQLNKGDIFFEK